MQSKVEVALPPTCSTCRFWNREVFWLDEFIDPDVPEFFWRWAACTSFDRSEEARAMIIDQELKEEFVEWAKQSSRQIKAFPMGNITRETYHCPHYQVRHGGDEN